MNTVETKMPLVNDLRERAASYRLGGPSSEHTAKMLEDAALNIQELVEALKELADIGEGLDDPTGYVRSVARAALAKAITAPTEEKAL